MMRMFTVALALFGSVALGAQAPTQQAPADRPAAPPAQQQPATPAPEAQTPAQSTAPKPVAVTLSGCLKPGASAGSFILADAGAVPAPSAGAAKPEPEARGTTGATKSYNLMPAKTGDDLSKHMNHKIEVTGTVSPSAPSASVPPAPPAGAPQPSETLNIQTFKMLSAACP